MRGFAAVVVVLGMIAGPGAASALADISMTVEPVSVTEGGALTVTVTRTGVNLSTASVTVVTGASQGSTPDTATAPADYTALGAPSNTLTWSFGENGMRTLTVQTADDTLDEADLETITVRISNSSEQVVSATGLTRTISDNDDSPTLTIGDASVAEGTGAGPTVLSFPLTLSAASGQAVTANYATADGTALAGQDFTLASGTVSIPAGSTTGSIDVQVAADATVEGNETLTMTLTPADPPTATIGTPGTATGTITNDDTPPTLSIAGPAPKAEGSGGLTTPFDFVLSLSKPSATAVMVSYSTADGSASAPEDYLATEQSVTFAPGETTKTVSIAVRADNVIEPNEDVTVTISDTGGLVATVSGATAIIVDDDTPPPPPPPPPADLTPPAIKLSKITSSRGVMRVTVTCPVGEPLCRGTVTVFSVPARKHKVKSLRREVKLGSSIFALTSGQKAKLTLRPSKRVARIIRQARSVKARAYAVARDTAGNIGTAQSKGTVKAR